MKPYPPIKVGQNTLHYTTLQYVVWCDVVLNLPKTKGKVESEHTGGDMGVSWYSNPTQKIEKEKITPYPHKKRKSRVRTHEHEQEWVIWE